MDRICVIGGGGSIGIHFPEFNSLVKSNLRLEAPEHEFVDFFKKQNISSVVNLAAMTDPVKCEADPELAFEINGCSPKKLFKAATKAECHRFIQVSTSHVYGATSTLCLLNVKDKCMPQSVYGKSKMAGEENLIASFGTDGPCLTILRVFSVVANNMRQGFLYQNLIERAKRQDHSPIRGLGATRDFVSATTVAQTILLSTESSARFELRNVCSGIGTKISELVSQVYREYGANPELIENMSEVTCQGDFIVGDPKINKIG